MNKEILFDNNCLEEDKYYKLALKTIDDPKAKSEKYIERVADDLEHDDWEMAMFNIQNDLEQYKECEIIGYYFKEKINQKLSDYNCFDELINWICYDSYFQRWEKESNSYILTAMDDEGLDVSKIKIKPIGRKA